MKFGAVFFVLHSKIVKEFAVLCALDIGSHAKHYPFIAFGLFQDYVMRNLAGVSLLPVAV